jgi:hypothetical protein
MWSGFNTRFPISAVIMLPMLSTQTNCMQRCPSFLPDKLPATRQVNKLQNTCEARRPTTGFSKVHQTEPILSRTDPPHTILWDPFNFIIFSSTPMLLKRFPPAGSQANILHAFLISPTFWYISLPIAFALIPSPRHLSTSTNNSSFSCRFLYIRSKHSRSCFRNSLICILLVRPVTRYDTHTKQKV